jgi:hypothetical protein
MDGAIGGFPHGVRSRSDHVDLGLLVAGGVLVAPWFYSWF